jgi:hypothetical protein
MKDEPITTMSMVKGITGLAVAILLAYANYSWMVYATQNKLMQK